MKIEANGSTDKGRVRANNQDAYFVDASLGLFIVADGMGGHVGGEVASKICIETVEQKIREESATRRQIDMLMSDSIRNASIQIYQRALENPELRGMGTTASALFIQGRYAYMGHVGDSRIYLLRQGFIYQLSEDHTLVQEQVQAGVLTDLEAKSHKLRNVITRSVGFLEDEYVDTATWFLEHRDRLVICSDGLAGYVSNREIAKIVSDYDLDSVNHLIDLANERGGEDNITVLVVSVQ
jgi:protein phosphatase